MNTQNQVKDLVGAEVEQKHWLDSLTVRANILAIVPAVYGISKAFGIEIPDGTLETIADGAAAVITVVSIVGVFIGRFKADKPLGFSPKK